MKKSQNVRTRIGRRLTALLVVFAGIGAATSAGAQATFPGTNGDILLHSQDVAVDEASGQPTAGDARLDLLTPDGRRTAVPTSVWGTPPEATFSPRDKSIFYGGYRPAAGGTTGLELGLFRLAPLGSETRLVWNLLTGDGGNGWGDPFGRFSLSPDGSSVLRTQFEANCFRVDPCMFGDDNGLYIKNLKTGAVARLDLPAGIQPLEGIWSPTGDRTAFLSVEDPERSEPASLYVGDGEGGSMVPILTTNLEINSISDLAFSPDGTHLAFTGSTSTSPGEWTENIYIVRTDGTELERLTDDHRSRRPVFSPDGRSVAYTRDRIEGGPNNPVTLSDVWRMDVDGSDQREFIVAKDTSEIVAWDRGALFRVVRYLPNRSKVRVRVFSEGKLSLNGPRVKYAARQTAGRGTVDLTARARNPRAGRSRAMIKVHFRERASGLGETVRRHVRIGRR